MRQLTKLLNGCFVLLSMLLCTPAKADWQLNLTRGVTPISKDIYDLHMIVLWICVGIAVVVFSVLIYSIIRHRKSRGVKPAEFHEHSSLEFFWAIIPFLILVIMAIPATRVLIAMDDTAEADITVKITGYQWKWQYEYLNQGIRFFSNLATPYTQIQNTSKKTRWYLYEVDRPLVLPINKKIRFLVTSADVIHSWWVPDFGIKRDAVPGFVYEAWARIDKPGVYRGQCAELCGVNHAYMPIVVKAVSDEQFQQWVKKERGIEDKRQPKAEPEVTTPTTEKPELAPPTTETKAAPPKPEKKDWTKKELVDMGKIAYDKYCVACHRPDGSGMPPVFPALKGSSVSVGEPIAKHIDIILNGIPGSAMQAFRAQMSDTEIAAVVTYERNAWGNNTGDIVTPEIVKAEREKEKTQ